MERGKRNFLRLLFIFPFAFFSLLAPRLFFNPIRVDEPALLFSSTSSDEGDPARNFPRSSISCDRSSFSTDVCVLRGDVRTNPSSFSIHLHSSRRGPVTVEKIRPYTRKWETKLMKTITELNLKTLNNAVPNRCDVVYSVPAVVFSTGGYTGNVFHDFNDGIVPLYVTSAGFNREVVFLIVNYKMRWFTKYREVLSVLSNYPPMDFFSDNRTLCFPEVTVGLQTHGDLAVDPSRMSPQNKTINDFQQLLHDAFFPAIEDLGLKENTRPEPKMVIIFRKGSRAVENENEVVQLCEKLGFRVQVLRPSKKTKLAEIYWALNSSDAMLGVVGCALTHLLFMRPGAVFIQVKPLGTEWAAETNYGAPAQKLGLKYIPYRIKPWESSLSRVYKKDDPVLTDPESIASQGWDVTKRVFLDKQTVRLDLNRFKESLTAAYQYLIDRKKANENSSQRSEP